jgi:hypothetical protein
MIGQQVAQGALFYSFRLDEHVPADHLLRRIDGLLDFGFVREALAASYSSTGRPSVDPELMLRMLLVGYLFGISIWPIAGSAGSICLTGCPTIRPFPKTAMAAFVSATCTVCCLNRW